MKPNTKFYVYEHWRPDEGVIFYVGKGQKRRAWDTHRGRNRWHKSIVAKLKSLGLRHEIRIVNEYKTEREAFAREIELIAYWLAQGAVLVNQSAGGEGPSGYKFSEERKRAASEKSRGRKVSAEGRAKLSEAMKGNKNGLGKKRPQHAIDATAAFWRGRPKSPESIEKMRKSRKGQFLGRKLSPEWCENIRRAQLGKPKPESTKLAMRGIPKSEEHKRKLRECNLGKTHTEESRRKNSEASKALWAKRRAEGTVGDISEKMRQGLARKNKKQNLNLTLPGFEV